MNESIISTINSETLEINYIDKERNNFIQNHKMKSFKLLFY